MPGFPRHLTVHAYQPLRDASDGTLFSSSGGVLMCVNATSEVKHALSWGMNHGGYFDDWHCKRRLTIKLRRSASRRAFNGSGVSSIRLPAAMCGGFMSSEFLLDESAPYLVRLPNGVQVALRFGNRHLLK